MTELPKPTAGAKTGEFISYKRDMILRPPVRAVAESAIEIGTRMVFAGEDLIIKPPSLARECQRRGVSIDHWFGKANSWKSQRGRQSGSGCLLMLAGDYAKIEDPLHQFHQLLIISGADRIEVNRLCVLDATVALLTGSSINDETPLVLTLADARYHAANRSAINHVYNLRQHDGKFDKTTGDQAGNPVSPQRMLRDIWERYLEELFGKKLQIHASVSETVPALDNLLFCGWTAWEAFWYVLDIQGWDFALKADGEPWVFKLDEANPQDALQTQAIKSAIIGNSKSADRSPLPEVLTVIAPTRDYQWWIEDGRLTPQDHWRRYQSYTLDFSLPALIRGGVDSSRIIPASKQIIWCPRPAITNDKHEFVNEEEISGLMKELATSRAMHLVSADTSDEYEFSLVWDFQPGPYYESVEWGDRGDGITTRISHADREWWFSDDDANGNKLIPIDVFDYREPPFRAITCVVIEVSSGQTEVPPNGHCYVRPLSGHEHGDQSEWMERGPLVGAYNVTDGGIKIGARAFAIWNYQVAEGGFWCIVSASETPIKVDDLALLRIIGPVTSAGSSEPGAAILNPPDCLYHAQILALNKPPCDESWNNTEQVLCFDFRDYKPKAVISFNEIYLGFLVSPNAVSRRLFGIVTETPNLQRVKNTSQEVLSQFRPAEIVGHDNTPKDFAHHHILNVEKVSGDYADYCIMAFDCKYNEVGWAWTHGTCPAFVALRNPTHKWADTRTDANALTSGHEGSARIVRTDIGGNIGLALVHLGELEDVAVCGKLYADLSAGSVDGMVELEGHWIQSDVHYDCVTGCNLKAGTQVLIQFSRVAKFWRIIGFPPALRTAVETTCIGAGTPPLDNDCMEKIVWMKGLKANYDIQTVMGKPVRRIKVGPNGIDGAITYVTNIVCNNGVITFTKRTLTFECGIVMSDTSAGSDDTDCCVVLAGDTANPTLAECMCCGDCPDCTTCEAEYNVNIGSPFSGICSCVNGTIITLLQSAPELCEYAGQTDTNCLDQSILCDFPDPPIEGEDPPQLRCNGDPDGDLCLDCTEAAVNSFCCPDDSWGLRTMTGTLRCEAGQWILHLEGGTVGPCPHVTWTADGMKPAGGNCPTGTYSMEFVMDHQCDEEPDTIICNVPSVFTSPVTIS